LREAQAAWGDACGRAAELHAELGRRREAYDLFLRWVASGQISAFALTEPSAGSGTARVATRARLHSVPVEVEADGGLRVIPAGGKEPRYLLDARRLEFRWEGEAPAEPSPSPPAPLPPGERGEKSGAATASPSPVLPGKPREYGAYYRWSDT